jgi:hypothetical protein
MRSIEGQLSKFQFPGEVETTGEVSKEEAGKLVNHWLTASPLFLEEEKPQRGRAALIRPIECILKREPCCAG